MDAITIFDGLEAIYRAGAKKARSWPFNNDMLNQAEVLDAMADEAKRQVEILDSRHD